MLRLGKIKVANEEFYGTQKPLKIWNVKGYLRYKTIFCYKVAFDV